jgi:YVTN family beta-propeller protein
MRRRFILGIALGDDKKVIKPSSNGQQSPNIVFIGYRHFHARPEIYIMLKLRPILVSISLALSIGTAHAAPMPDGVVYSANEGDGSISAIELRTGAVSTTSISITPHNVQISPDGQILLAVGSPKSGSKEHGDHGGHGQTEAGDKGLLLLESEQPANVLKALPSGNHPAHVVTSQDGRYAYITNTDNDLLTVVDTQLEIVAAEVDTGSYPHGLRLSPDGAELYIANVTDNSVSVIDTENLKETARIHVGQAPVQVAYTPDGKYVYVSLRDENKVAIIDTETREVVDRVSVGRNPIQLFAASDAKMYVANQGDAADPDDSVTVIDTNNRTVVSTIVTGKGAHGLVASDDGDFMFVTNNVDNTVSAIDVRKEKVIATFLVGPNPNGITYRSVR